MKVCVRYFNRILKFGCCAMAPLLSAGQTTIVKDSALVKGTTVVIPGKEYKRSGYHNFFWGKHYREEWATPVRVPDFYLDTAAGGLTPYEKGGGRQSKTLRLRNKKGKEYVLRSVNKDFGRALPEEMRGTFLSRILKDQVSIGHPFAGISITPMIEATGIYHTIPVIVFVPRQAALAEYNEEYGDQLYLFEERPDENQQDAPNFGHSVNVIGSEKLFEHLYKDNDNHVDQLAFLRARLFDMFIGDWGRHPDNWRWAKFEIGKDNIYKPVPRDRDQAYTKLDGLYPSLAGKFYKPLQGFNHTLKSGKGWNMPGRSLDKIFLTSLEKEVWLTQAADLQKILTDSLIEYSIRLLPPALFTISGTEIITKLKSRRDHLKEYAEEYYDFLSRYVDIVGSQDREYFSVNRLPGNETEITGYKITKDGSLREQPFYSRKFTRNETKEVRIYGLESSDRIEVKGNEGGKVKVRIIDPEGSDSIAFCDRCLKERIAISSGRKFEYDTVHKEKVDFSIRPIISSAIYKIFDRNPLRLFPRTGIKVISSITYNVQPWRRPEYENVHQICANYGFLRGAFNVGYVGRFGHLMGKWDLVLKARLDAPAVENYFGTGNNTEIVNKTRNYYRTFSHRVFGSVGIESNFSDNHHLELSAVYQSVKVLQKKDHVVLQAQALLDPSVFERNRFAGVEGGYFFQKLDNQVFPVSGVGIGVGAGYLWNIQQTSESFAKVLLTTAAFVPLSKQFSLALRAGAATVAGTANYYNLNSIGGGGSGEIRGYQRERFYGKHSFYANGDLRWLFNTKNYLFNGKAGLLGFYDVGRVWQPGETSKKWHGSYGGGIILVPYNKYALTVTYGISPEGRHINFKTGIFF
jgi:hypothetical protein